MTSLLRSSLSLLAQTFSLASFQWVTPLSFSWPSSIFPPAHPCCSFTTYDNSLSAFLFSLWNSVSFFLNLSVYCTHVYVHACSCVGMHVCATVHRGGQRTATGVGTHLPHCVRHDACLLLTRQPSHLQGFSCGCLPSCLGILELRYGALLYVYAGDRNSSLHAYTPPQLEQHLFFLCLTPPRT